MPATTTSSPSARTRSSRPSTATSSRSPTIVDDCLSKKNAVRLSPSRVGLQSQIIMGLMMQPPSDTTRLVAQAAQGDRQAWGRLLERHRDRLRRMIALRLDLRLQGRVDPSDVIQEGYLAASRRFADYAKDPAMPFFVWLRFLVSQELQALHR